MYSVMCSPTVTVGAPIVWMVLLALASVGAPIPVGF